MPLIIGGILKRNRHKTFSLSLLIGWSDDPGFAGQTQKRIFYYKESCFLCPDTSYDDDVISVGQLMFMEPAGLSDQPCDAMADNTISHLLTDGNPDPVLSRTISTHVQDKIAVHI